MAAIDNSSSALTISPRTGGASLQLILVQQKGIPYIQPRKLTRKRTSSISDKTTNTNMAWSSYDSFSPGTVLLGRY